MARMKAPFSFLPALPAATGVAAGILVCEFTSWPVSLIAGSACLLTFIALYFNKHHYISFYFLCTVAGICCAFANFHFKHPVDFAVPGSHFIKARVIEDNKYSNTPSLTVEFLTVDSLPTLPFRCNLSSDESLALADLQSIVSLHCHINYVSSKTDVPYEFDNTRSMFNDGIYLTAYPAGKEILISPPPQPFRTINTLRNDIYKAIVNSPINGETASFLIAVILGEKNYLSSDTLANYRSLGVAHVLALSGLHVGLLASLFGFLIWPVRFLPHYRFMRVMLLLSAIWTYTLVCGCGDSILRAAIMLSIMSVSSLLQRSYHPANALLLAITIILCTNPSSLFSPGFQLSIGAVISIILFLPVVPKTLKRYPLLFYMSNLIVLPVAAMLGTGIISAFHFSAFPLAFFPANIIIGLIFPYILVAGVAVSLFTAVGIDFPLLGSALDHALSIMNRSIGFVMDIFPSSVGLPHFSAWAFFPYIAAITMLAIALYRRRGAPAVAAMAFFIITFIVIDTTSPAVPVAELYIVRYPSTCIMVRSGERAALLPTCHDYDTLVTRRIVESRCQNFLKCRKCNSLINLSENPAAVKGFYLGGDCLYAGDKQLYILNDDSVDISFNARPNYLYVGQKFTGNLRLAVELLSPDSIILPYDLNPSRRKRFIREVNDPSILIDLRHRPFAIVWTKQ